MAPTIRLKIERSSYQKLKEKQEALYSRLRETRQRKYLCCANEKIGSIEDTSSEWLLLLNEEARWLSEIRELTSILSEYEVVDDVTITDSDTIGVGTRVTLSIIYGPDDIEENTYKLVSMYPDVSKNEISKSSPIGAAIFGKHVGERVSFTVPATGSTAVVKILSIHSI